jgi:hypothetical protein
MGIFDHLGSIAQSDAGKAFDTAHEHFQHRLNVHGHFGRALLESLAETCRNHPNIVGVVVGVLVEQLLVHEKHHHEAVVEAERNGHGPAHAPSPHPAPPHAPHHELKLWRIRPGRIAFEVFGALVLLKFGVGIARIFSRKKPALAPVARIHLFSATLAAYYAAKVLKSPEVSAWRNAAVFLFATDALKPMLKPDYSRPPPSPHRPPQVRSSGAAPESEMGHAPAHAPTVFAGDGHEFSLH